MKKLIVLLSVVLLVSSVVGNAQALVRLDWKMNVTSAEESDLLWNLYGLGLGDSFSAFAIYDDAVLTGIGEEFIYFTSSTNKMEFNPPSIPPDTFNEAMPASGPYIKFVDGSPTAISYLADVWVTQEDLSMAGPGDPRFGVCRLNVFEGGFILNDVIGTTLRGDYDNFSQTHVPEPATLLLLGTGLIGLVGLRRKFRT